MSLIVQNRVLVIVARYVLALYLFGFGIASVQACESLTATPAAAFAHHEMPCHQHAQPNKNACLMHCMQSDQAANSPISDQVAQHAFAPVTTLPFHGFAVPPARALPLRIAATDSGPPIPIAFCRFLN